MELIFPARNRRLFLSVSGAVTIGELKQFLKRNFEINNASILIMAGGNHNDETSLTRAGAHTGTGVMICERSKC